MKSVRPSNILEFLIGWELRQRTHLLNVSRMNFLAPPAVQYNGSVNPGPGIRINGSPAKRGEIYANLSAEWWSTVGQLIEHGQIIIPNDEKLIAQLTSRRKLYDSKGREKLESKADLGARGVESPLMRSSEQSCSAWNPKSIGKKRWRSRKKSNARCSSIINAHVVADRTSSGAGKPAFLHIPISGSVHLRKMKDIFVREALHVREIARQYGTRR
jgi:hypothetical protein